MQIELQARGFELTPGLRDFITRRLSHALAHARNDVRKVMVRISDDNGPKHGIDKRCMVRIALRGRKDVVVQDIRGDMYTAIGHAASRAAHAVKRLLHFRRKQRHARHGDVVEGEIIH